MVMLNVFLGFCSYVIGLLIRLSLCRMFVMMLKLGWNMKCQKKLVMMGAIVYGRSSVMVSMVVCCWVWCIIIVVVNVSGIVSIVVLMVKSIVWGIELVKFESAVICEMLFSLRKWFGLL